MTDHSNEGLIWCVAFCFFFVGECTMCVEKNFSRTNWPVENVD